MSHFDRNNLSTTSQIFILCPSREKYFMSLLIHAICSSTKLKSLIYLVLIESTFSKYKSIFLSKWDKIMYHYFPCEVNGIFWNFPWKYFIRASLDLFWRENHPCLRLGRFFHQKRSLEALIKYFPKKFQKIPMTSL